LKPSQAKILRWLLPTPTPYRRLVLVNFFVRLHPTLSVLSKLLSCSCFFKAKTFSPSYHYHRFVKRSTIIITKDLVTLSTGHFRRFVSFFYILWKMLISHLRFLVFLYQIHLRNLRWISNNYISCVELLHKRKESSISPRQLQYILSPVRCMIIDSHWLFFLQHWKYIK